MSSLIVTVRRNADKVIKLTAHAHHTLETGRSVGSQGPSSVCQPSGVYVSQAKVWWIIAAGVLKL